MADEIHDLHALVEQAPLNQRGAPFAEFDGCRLVVARFSQHPKWEIHPRGDEFLQILDGELELTLLSEDGSTRSLLPAGSVTVVPRNTWHSPVPQGTVALLAMANYDGTAVSDEEDPRS